MFQYRRHRGKRPFRQTSEPFEERKPTNTDDNGRRQTPTHPRRQRQHNTRRRSHLRLRGPIERIFKTSSLASVLVSSTINTVDNPFLLSLPDSFIWRRDRFSFLEVPLSRLPSLVFFSLMPPNRCRGEDNRFFWIWCLYFCSFASFYVGFRS